MKRQCRCADHNVPCEGELCHRCAAFWHTFLIRLFLKMEGHAVRTLRLLYASVLLTRRKKVMRLQGSCALRGWGGLEWSILVRAD